MLGTKPGLLHSQIKNLSVPEGFSLSRVKVFSSMDDELSLNVFTLKEVQVAYLPRASLNLAAKSLQLLL